jgi:hypothetical protein
VVGGAVVGGGVVGGAVVGGGVVTGAGVVGGATVVGADGKVDGDGVWGAVVVATVGGAGLRLIGTVWSTTFPGMVVGRAGALVAVPVVCCVVTSGAVEVVD